MCFFDNLGLYSLITQSLGEEKPDATAQAYLRDGNTTDTNYRPPLNQTPSSISQRASCPVKFALIGFLSVVAVEKQRE